eukprot:SM005946S19309  [mRNA]  locus=s5946:725:775:- [translate_table: standard]
MRSAWQPGQKRKNMPIT